MDRIWTRNPGDYAKIEFESRKVILFPKLADLLNKNPHKHILDYGCGDGSFEKFLKKNLNIGLYDISSKSLSLAKKNLKSCNFKYYSKSKEIPSNSFDFVIFSMVLMTISNTKSINYAFNELKRVKTKKGLLIISITHPCFRQYNYSSFHTEYAENKSFHYLENGQRFKVYLRDLKTDYQLSFYDYHWSLSTTFNLILKSRLLIREVIEVYDKVFEGSYYNKYFPPYLIIICA